MDAELSLSILFSLSRFLHDKHGVEELDKAASIAGVTTAEVLKGKRWVSVEQVEAFLEHVNEILEGDELAFRKAAAYRLSEAYGPLRFILWALSPGAVYKQAMKNFHVMSSCGSYELLAEGSQWIHVLFRSSKETSRLLCLIRQANIVAMPTFWGLPPAEVSEEGCLASEDDGCIYHITWRRKQSWWPLTAGLTLGCGAAFGLEALGMSSSALMVTMPLLGASVGHIVRQQLINKANLRYAQENNEALQQIAQETTEARQEIVALHERQREWSSLMEERLDERSVTLNKVIETLNQLQEERVAVVREYSHDLRNPLTVMKSSAEYLGEFRREGFSSQQLELVQDLADAADKMEVILNELMTVVTSDTRSSRRSPERIDIHDFVNQVRRQLRAFVYGRDIRVSAFCTREAPDAIETDRLLFERIIDNLLFNAAKYSDKGSIVVEIDGLPEYLAVKISDTGRGIDEDEIEHIFRPGGSSVESRAEKSYGLGLSVVVKLLDDIGGRLEVLSKPGLGTTFWVFFPTQMASSLSLKEREKRDGEDGTEAVTRVVTIRRQASGK